MRVGKNPLCHASVRPSGPCAQRDGRETSLNFAKFRDVSRTFPFAGKARRAFSAGWDFSFLSLLEKETAGGGPGRRGEPRGGARSPAAPGFRDGVKTYNDLYLDLRHTLKAGGVEDYNLEAKLLIGAAAGKTREELIRDMRLYALGDVEEKAAELTRRRLAGEPVAYVLGEWEFMGLPFTVDKSVLIPRPDTELLAGLAIRLLRARVGSEVRVLDLCTGTGCVGISIAKLVASCRVVLVDNSPGAVRLARENVLRNNVSRNTICVNADVRRDPPMLLGKFDLIVCNPPYVPTGEIQTLDRGVRDFEPRAALDGGRDGLDLYRAIIPNWTGILKENGCALFECGEEQAGKIQEMLKSAGFKSTAAYPDPAGTLRVVAGVI